METNFNTSVKAQSTSSTNASNSVRRACVLAKLIHHYNTTMKIKKPFPPDLHNFDQSASSGISLESDGIPGAMHSWGCNKVHHAQTVGIYSLKVSGGMNVKAQVFFNHLSTWSGQLCLSKS